MQKSQSPPLAIRTAYQQQGVTAFYQQFGKQYRNPHESAIVKIIQALACQLDLTNVLDLACGSGEVTLALKTLGYTKVTGMDPYTFEAYRERTGKVAEKYSFEDVENGILADHHYTIIICSFALHLVDTSRLPKLLYQLNRITPSLLVITPHKRPEIKPTWGWTLLEEVVIERVRGRFYQSSHSGNS